ncbi:GGDEF domain-containing protein, partial [Saprospiraceae bacterium]|nr:GGDEF domain-containing protein [Saprospiraceae bacterium]
NALVKLMSSTDQLNVDVDEHNEALASAHKELASMPQNTDFEDFHVALMSNITQVVHSNRRLENDLVLSKYALEQQAQEIDLTRKEARTDVLCGIGNRTAVDETLNFMICRFGSEKSSFGLMLIDVDHFKRINDSFGHVAGDEVLTSIAVALKECVRPEDFVGRLGGDEFVILLEGLTADTADAVGLRIRQTIELHDFSVNNKGQSTVVTLSMGLAVVSENDTATSLYERADQALYKSKSLGRNRLSVLLAETLGGGDSADKSGQIAEEPTRPTVSTYEKFKASFDLD